MIKPATILFMGTQGSGKGTQTKLLSDYLRSEGSYPVLLYEAGAQFRAFAEDDNYTARLIKASIERGGVQPVAFSVLFWTRYFIDHIETKDVHLVIDGSPRKPLEAQVLEGALHFYTRIHPIVFNIELDLEIAVERLKKRGRKDDTEEGIRERLRWFSEEVLVSLDYYRKSDYLTVTDIDGNGSIEEIHQAIVEHIHSEYGTD